MRKVKNFTWQPELVDVPMQGYSTTQDGMISHGASDLQTSHDFDQIAENCFECVSIDERFLSVSVDLVLRMTALWRLEILNLRMTKLLFKFVPFRGSFITENCSIYQRSTGDVMAAMLVVKNKNISFLWELNSIFMYTLWKKKCRFDHQHGRRVTWHSNQD